VIRTTITYRKNRRLHPEFGKAIETLQMRYAVSLNQSMGFEIINREEQWAKMI